ncbi:MAG: PEP-CTERM sorting domain-containing protein [Acidobacteriia bacterium]|nr:PEP-CTERM sorting domain-containing protein [Terriglobia bacterium]
MKLRSWISLAVLGLLLLLPIGALADQYTISVPNAQLSGTPGPYATVDLVLNGDATITVTVTMLSNFTTFGNGAGNGAFGFNVDGSTAGLNITGLTGQVEGGGVYGGSLSWDPSGGNFDGFGNFDVGIQDGTPGGLLAIITFTVSRDGGFSSASDLYSPNDTGSHFAVHVAPTNGNPTGFAGDGTPTTIPEPGSLMLFGTGLLGLAGFIRRRLKA